MIAALWIAVSILLALLTGCVQKIISYRREAMRLHDQIQAFLSGEIISPAFSVKDNYFAMFENAVIELEARLLQSRENTHIDNAKNRAFVQDVSHQFKTPIAGLRLFCEVDASAHQEQELHLIERMEMLINSLLKLEKLRSDGYTLEYEDCDLRELTLELRTQFTLLFPQKNISVTGEAQIRCDAYWISEALSNLIKNACEHTAPDGRIVISLAQSNSEAVIQIEDDGGGVAPDTLRRLFDRFYRSEKPANTQGVGLGLAITKTIIQNHHGSILVKNGSRGLIFTIYLPVLHGMLKKM